MDILITYISTVSLPANVINVAMSVDCCDSPRTGHDEWGYPNGTVMVFYSGNETEVQMDPMVQVDRWCMAWYICGVEATH